MDVFGLLLGVLGILLTIVLSEPVLRGARTLMSDHKRSVWSAAQYRKGRLQNQRHFGFERWSVRLVVNDDGDTIQEFDARVVNLSTLMVPHLHIPFFSDGGGLSREFMQPWARSGRKELQVEFDTIDTRRSQGRIKIHHEPPLAPGERRNIKWGLTMPKVLEAGDDYYDWDVEVPYFDMKGTIEFSRKWRVLYAQWDASNATYLPPPDWGKSLIKWQVTLPAPGMRLHLRFGLSAGAPSHPRFEV